MYHVNVDDDDKFVNWTVFPGHRVVSVEVRVRTQIGWKLNRISVISFDILMFILLVEDELTADIGSRDQYGGQSTGSRLCGRSTRGRRQKVSGDLMRTTLMEFL